MQHFTVFGYARSKMTDAELRTMVSKTLTCRIDKRWKKEIENPVICLTWSLVYISVVSTVEVSYIVLHITHCACVHVRVHVFWSIMECFELFRLWCILSAGLSGRTAVKRWSNFLKDVSTILVNMIHRKTLQS